MTTRLLIGLHLAHDGGPVGELRAAVVVKSWFRKPVIIIYRGHAQSWRDEGTGEPCSDDLSAWLEHETEKSMSMSPLLKIWSHGSEV